MGRYLRDGKLNKKAEGCPSRLGLRRDWRKIKTATWRDANSERWHLFEKG
jgi:hypothetical protein